MIFEQAFIALPEFLVGTGFDRYDNEGTLVLSYAMAVLQELNGRNVNNPISLISGEKTYPQTRNRRVDLHLEYGGVGTLNPKLSAFGVRPESWLEAKFFRKSNGARTLDKLLGAYTLLRDLFRLCVLPPETIGDAPNCSRYLLHVYEGIPKDHLAMGRNVGRGRKTRSWLKNLHEPGRHIHCIDDLSDEPDTFDQEIGVDLRNTILTVTTTTFPINQPGAAYSLYLTRIESFELKLESRSISLTSSLSSEGSPEDWYQLRDSYDKGFAK